jgi:glutathione reductase (NADPH)
MKRYRQAVIGSSTAATVVATTVMEAGWTVALVDFRPLGDTCRLWGCVRFTGHHT